MYGIEYCEATAHIAWIQRPGQRANVQINKETRHET